MTPVEQMTDADIIAAVRNGNCALVPVTKDSDAVVGEIDLDDWEATEGEVCLLIKLSHDAAKFVASQVIR
jgi:hypothetical protein